MFVLLPILQVVTFPPLTDYLDFTANGRWLRAAANTCRMVVLSTASATLVGFIYAFALSRPDRRLRGALRLIATAAALLAALHPGVLLSADVRPLRADHPRRWPGWRSASSAGEPLGGADLTHFPYRRARHRAHPRRRRRPQLEIAARNLGGAGLPSSPTVTLPLVRPAVAGAALLVAIYVLADFANPLVIGGDFPLLATEAWYRIDGWGDMRGATLMAATLLPPALCFFVLERFWVSRRRYTVISGRGSALERAPLRWLVGWASRLFCSLVAALILSLYFGVVAGGFTETWGVDWTPTLDKWPVVLDKVDHLGHSAALRRGRRA